MYSRCPHCDCQQQLSTRQLRDGRGLLNCAACGRSFDALPSLSDMIDERHDSPSPPELTFPRPASPLAWRIGNAVLLLVLLGQIAYFERENLLRRPPFYSALTQVCRLIGCRVPPYRNPADWSISHSEWQAHLDNRYVLTAALTNQAEFSQAFPALKLTVNDYNGRLLAERLFPPATYTHETLSAAKHTEQIRLAIVISAPSVGGFTLTTM
ncbi:DUF3426 domain-containing protein [Methylomonas sp. SURF-2]|uniref:DUF3426 domain-containing protein n=1 Tax=Methylomonas subterranea TaxID=2952225 RepID=A0ABT1TMB8_9GAMM|nr:zinc-ribbon and DUF3426 domain-containing protein [Methylomonas sp. SURF-2]MCQ8106366.1 DUF3426 domain-containing protein [Methylomonas sp. SURF-2]